MSSNLYAVIMAGGKGERFWPLSTSRHPKQLLSLIGDKSLLALSVERLEGIIPPEQIIIVTSADLVDLTIDAAPMIPRENIIGEPFARDTAAAIAIGSVVIKNRDPEAVFCVMTADHIIKDNEIFHKTLKESFAFAAANDALVTIGVQPTFPSTGFGYIETAEKIDCKEGACFSTVARFVEKPDIDTAEGYLEKGNFCWNSGIFIWSIRSFEKAMAKHCTVLTEMISQMELVVGTPEFDSLFEAEYKKLDKISIDYALMEKADNIVMARCSFRWDDVGTWVALANHFEEDSGHNVVIGNCENIESKENIIVSKDRLTALVGVEDLVVVQGENVTLVCAKDRVQEVKQMVKLLEEKGCYKELL